MDYLWNSGYLSEKHLELMAIFSGKIWQKIDKMGKG